MDTMNELQLAMAIQEDLMKAICIIKLRHPQLMNTSCHDLSSKHECDTPLATLLSNIDEAADHLIEKHITS